jgi:ElaB/YqjD/DUF883 family membrane-anchored ribosome-binding protein
MSENIQMDVALLQRDTEQTTAIVTKLDNAIEKLTNLGNDITKMLALHEQRLNRLEQIDNEIHGLVEKRRVELQTDIVSLEGKLASSIKEISSDITSTEDRIMGAIKDVKTDIKEDRDESVKTHGDLVKRVEALEKWRWMMVGGGVAIGVLVTKIIFPILHIGV